MNGICLICGKKLNNTFVCECGYDETKYYDRYKTLDVIGTDIFSCFKQRTIFSQEQFKVEAAKMDLVTLGNLTGRFPEKLVSVDTQVGSRLTFGKNPKTLKPFMWKVLDRVGNQVLLLSDASLGEICFGKSNWEFSHVRRWLNEEYFLSFSETDQQMIVTQKIENKANSQYGTPAGNDTFDRVFLLSEEEVEKYLPNKEMRIVQNVEDGNGVWGLRTPGFNTECVMVVDRFGNIRRNGTDAGSHIRVRPAMWINLAVSSKDDMDNVENDTEMYKKGVALYKEKNYTASMEWFEKSAAKGNSNAMNYLGFIYYYGHGVEVNYEKAREWFTKAVEKGHIEAGYKLGQIYYLGQGVDKDYVIAKDCFEKAAERGVVYAMNYLGYIYSNENRYGMERDNNKAIEWFKKAAEHGDEVAKKELLNRFGIK